MSARSTATTCTELLPVSAHGEVPAPTGPVLIHAMHQEGQGLCPRRRDRRTSITAYRQVRRRSTGKQSKPPSQCALLYHLCSRNTLADLEADEDDRPSWRSRRQCPRAPGVDLFEKSCFPSRCLRCRHRGAARGHLLRAAMAAAGMRPFCAIYSTFLQRGYDQVVHDVALQHLPVRFAIDRAGLVGADGADPCGQRSTCRLSRLRCPAWSWSWPPSDEAELDAHGHAPRQPIDERAPPPSVSPAATGVGVEMPERKARCWKSARAA